VRQFINITARLNTLGDYVEDFRLRPSFLECLGHKGNTSQVIMLAGQEISLSLVALGTLSKRGTFDGSRVSQLTCYLGSPLLFFLC